MNWDFSPKIVIQGITQPQALAFVKQSESFNNHFVGGISDNYLEENIDNIPIYDLVSSITKAHKNVTTSLIFNHPYDVLDACYEAINAGIKQLVIYSSQVSPLDLIKLYQTAENKQVKILGPNGGGIYQPQQYNAGVINTHLFTAGKIGIINCAHETIAQEVVFSWQDFDLGVSTLINVGNGYFTKINWDLWLNYLAHDENTRSILIIINRISSLEAQNLQLFLKQVKNKSIVIYLLNHEDWEEKIGFHQAKVICDRIYYHLYPIPAVELIKQNIQQKNVTIVESYQKILSILAPNP